MYYNNIKKSRKSTKLPTIISLLFNQRISVSCKNAPCCNPPRYRCPGRFGRWKHFLPCTVPLQSSACGSGSRFSHWRARSTWPRWSSDLSKISAGTPWCTAWSSLRHPDSPGPEHAPGLPESEGGYPPKWSLFLPHRPYPYESFYVPTGRPDCRRKPARTLRSPIQQPA